MDGQIASRQDGSTDRSTSASALGSIPQYYSRRDDSHATPASADDVTLYANATGLMWENAESFGARLVFAEHRYYGASQPFPDGTAGCLAWRTTEQAMSVFAELIRRRSLEFLEGSKLRDRANGRLR